MESQPVEAIDNLTLVALTPADMVPAQRDLATWCDRKIVAVKQELADLEANLELATEHGWKRRSVEASLNRTAKRILYYEKLKAAVEAGYLLIPNLPCDVFAVRVKRLKQPEKTHDSRWGGFDAKAQLLPAGDGRYVDDKLQYRDESYVDRSGDKEKHVKVYVTDDFDEVDFPVRMVKPAVLEATAKAMALKIFDRIGLVMSKNIHQAIETLEHELEAIDQKRGDIESAIGALRSRRGEGTGDCRHR